VVYEIGKQCKLILFHYVILTESSSDTEDSHLFSPPAWYSSSSAPSVGLHSESTGTSADAESKSNGLACPLAGLLPPEYANIDVTQLFPDFRPGQVSTLMTDVQQLAVLYIVLDLFSTVLCFMCMLGLCGV
jgi:hypothetical protein